GEGLGEHGEDEHGIFLYRYALQVPLMVKLPNGARGGTSVGTPVALSDVFTTLAEAAGPPGFVPPPGTMSLLEVAPEATPRSFYAETLFPRIHFGWSDLASLVQVPWQYVEAPKPELYDLDKDPAETRNLAAGLPPAFRTLRIEMEKRRAAFTAPTSVDPEETRKLASLGYLSTGATAGSGPLPDPKDEIFIVGDLKKVAALFLSKHYEEAIAGFQALREKHPQMKDLSDLTSQALQHLGRNEEALEVLKQGAAASPEAAANYALAIAELCLKLGRLEEARKHAEIARGRGDPGAADVLARIHLAEKNWNAAETEARAVLEARPTNRAALLVLARVELGRNDLPKALEFADRVRVVGEERATPNAHYVRGEILRRMKRFIEAEAEFEAEVRAAPNNLDAWCALAALRGGDGRTADAREAARRMVAAVPTAEAYARGVATLRGAGDAPGAEALRQAAGAKFPSDRRFRPPG
ncbi:MAG TPA: tetratricopeptide repeat protein, partial [Thermoanaerobaculia bacterium]|nr:tetratricopeptide repeat protein [Thermoanaerobaculia bacterium]